MDIYNQFSAQFQLMSDQLQFIISPTQKEGYNCRNIKSSIGYQSLQINWVVCCSLWL